MNITPKTQPDPVCDIKTHDGSLRWALQAAEEVAGKPGLTVVLNQSNLAYLVDAYPENLAGVSGKYTLGEYARLSVGLLNFFGRGGRSMIMRIGRISNQLGVEQLSSIMGGALMTALKLVPESMRVKKSLELVKFGFEKLWTYQGVQPLHISLEERSDTILIKFETCGCCCGYTADVPICYMFTGYFQEGMHGIFGKDREVEVKEIECRAMGAPACVWELSKRPVN